MKIRKKNDNKLAKCKIIKISNIKKTNIRKTCFLN
jgi:hypothetical protein